VDGVVRSRYRVYHGPERCRPLGNDTALEYSRSSTGGFSSRMVSRELMQKSLLTALSATTRSSRELPAS
jgi:hypothetical protein